MRAGKIKKDYRKYLLTMEAELTASIGLPLVEPDCFISWNGVRLISPSTLLTVQGKTGSHKSRLVQEFAIVSLDRDESSIGSKLGMLNISGRPLRVAYLDTERNSNFEFPFALKSIVDSSGVTVPCPDFRYSTLRDLDRLDRKDAAEQFIELVRTDYEGDLVVIVDVASDLTLDFNSVAATNELIDLFKKWMNVYHCAIIAVIHENPGSNKMRGHLGTELLNKATDSISITKKRSENSIEIEFLKIRQAGDQPNIEAFYNESTRRMELHAQQFEPNIREKFDQLLVDLFKEKLEYTRTELVIRCAAQLNRSKDSIDNYLKDTSVISIYNTDYQLVKGKNGRYTTYTISPIIEATGW